MPWRSFGVVFAVVMLAACGGDPMPEPVDAAADAPAVDAARDVAVDRPAEPTPAEWAACPDNLSDQAYTVTSCSYVSGGFGVSHPARLASAEPTWIVDSTTGNRALTLEEGIAANARVSTSFAALARCDMRAMPPACRCTTCAGQLFDVRTCPGFETGRMYLQLQLLRIGQMVERTGYCPRL